MIPTSCLGWWCLLWFMYHLQGLTPKRPDDSGEANRFYETKRGGWATPVTGVEFESTSKWRAPGWGRGLYYTHVGIINQRIPPQKNKQDSMERPVFFRGCCREAGERYIFFIPQMVSVRMSIFFSGFSNLMSVCCNSRQVASMGVSFQSTTSAVMAVIWIYLDICCIAVLFEKDASRWKKIYQQ